MVTIIDARPPRTTLAAVGLWLRDHQRAVRRLQWAIILVYAVLLITPTLLPLPDRAAHIWNNLTVFAQFVFWGIWWPGVLLSMIILGRLWCGILCPEGALTEFASRHGRGRATPRWIRWNGWPFAAFVMTTIYGQLVSVYQYPRPAALILGGSTLGAILIGYLYGREKRVWCRYLCPVNGVFALLSKLAPMHYASDAAAWEASSAVEARRSPANCAPLVPLRSLDSASPCHMCGRCAGFRDAIELKSRPVGSEVLRLSGHMATAWDSALIITGLMGVAIGAFQWSVSPWFVAVKQALATWLVEHGIIWPVGMQLPWWLLTNYPGQNDVLTVLDGTVLLVYITAVAVVMTLAVGLPLALAARLLGRWNWQRFHHLAQAFIPLAACGVILGLSAQTVNLLRADGFGLSWVSGARVAVLAAATAGSLGLVWAISGRYAASSARLAAILAVLPACAAIIFAWILQFWIW
jgi:polyferredoxin